MRGSTVKAWLAALVALLLAQAACGASAFERSTLTAEVEGTSIDVYLYRPDGAGPFPLIILSHGSPRSPRDRAGFGAGTMRAQAEAYAASGVAVAVPIRRGYGGNGEWAEGYGGCDHPDYYRAGLASARDLDAARAVAAAQPGVDGSRIVLMGVSAGGWASVAAATSGGVRGVVSFAGGRGSSGPDEVCGEDQLVGAAGRYGAASRAPELWIYSQNDHFFGPALARKMFAAFTGAGGRATFLAAPPYGEDGHKYIADIGSWKPQVDRFLRQIGFLGTAGAKHGAGGGADQGASGAVRLSQPQ
jgi:dienelactone hydrolase